MFCRRFLIPIFKGCSNENCKEEMDMHEQLYEELKKMRIMSRVSAIPINWTMVGLSAGAIPTASWWPQLNRAKTMGVPQSIPDKIPKAGDVTPAEGCWSKARPPSAIRVPHPKETY